MSAAIRRIALKVVSDPTMTRLFVSALVLGAALFAPTSPIGGGGGV